MLRFNGASDQELRGVGLGVGLGEVQMVVPSDGEFELDDATLGKGDGGEIEGAFEWRRHAGIGEWPASRIDRIRRGE